MLFSYFISLLIQRSNTINSSKYFFLNHHFSLLDPKTLKFSFIEQNYALKQHYCKSKQKSKP